METQLRFSRLLPGLLLLGTTIVLYVVARVVYNIFFHPLRSYPGPWHRGASRLPYTISIFRGDVTHRVKSLHEKYGQVVRITPDTLSYTCSQAWSDIYGLKQSNKRGNLPKDAKFYVKPPEGVDTISSANDVDHRRLRRIQAHAFSEKALSLQEGYLQQYTDQFVSCLRTEAHRSGGIVDVEKWLEFLTTDLIGDLSFGETFGGLATGKIHPWLDTVFTTLKAFTFMREVIRLPSFLIKAAMACIPRSLLEHRGHAMQFGEEAAKRRIARGSDKPDFMSYILKHEGDESRSMSEAEVTMAAITFIVAGSETTATMMSGTIYLLLRNPNILAKLTSTIRSDFPTRADITNTGLQQHEYLNAVIKEGLRLYPPAPDFLFRNTSHEGAIIAGRVVPPHTTVTMNLLAANRDPANFHRPLDFVPDRWFRDAPVEFQNDDRAVFKPFSVGPRDCIGKNLAWAEMRMILAKLVWPLELLALHPDSEGWIEQQKIYSLWEKVPLKVRIASRGD